MSETINVEAIFGENVFNDSVMKERLSLIHIFGCADQLAERYAHLFCEICCQDISEVSGRNYDVDLLAVCDLTICEKLRVGVYKMCIRDRSCTDRYSSRRSFRKSSSRSSRSIIILPERSRCTGSRFCLLYTSRCV